MANNLEPAHEHRPRTRRMPQGSFLYERVIPLVFILLGLVMLGLIFIAAGVLLGYVHYQ